MTSASAPVLRLGNRRVPVVLPTLRDARLHTAAVIISIHTIGILALGFRVSVPQILSAIFTAAAIDVGLTLRRTGQIVWPASGMLTGSGVALILRLVGMERADFWSWHGWYYFAAVAGLSVLTKYVIRFRGTHIFNPSNLGLVAAFLILGVGVVEPLDFWWAPLGPWMGLAYAVILVGGVAITRRLHLLGMAVTFWGVFAAGLGILAASGHCMTAAWSIGPVCGARFWSVLVTSPEVLIFLLFMITDPKTVPTGRVARLVFAGTLAIAATLLIAPQTTEFGAKVGLLGSLVLWSPARSVFDRLIPSVDVAGGLRVAIDRLVGEGPRLVTFGRGALIGSLSGLAVLGIVWAGGPARTIAQTVSGSQSLAISSIEFREVDLPVVMIDPSVDSLNFEVDSASAAEIASALAENLTLESEAMRTADASYLGAADGGERLDEMQARLDEAIATGVRVAHDYVFESLTVRAAERTGGQAGAALEFDGTGTITEVTFDALGDVQGSSEAEFASTFVVSQLGGDRWVIIEVLSKG